MRKLFFPILSVFISALILSFAGISVAQESRAPELSDIKAADVPQLVQQLQLPAVPVAAEAAILKALEPDGNGKPPVIITVPGLSFDEIGPGILEISTLKKIWHFFFPHKRDAVNNETLAAEVQKFNEEYFMLQEGEQIPELDTRIVSVDVHYLEDSMKSLPDFEARGLTVEPFEWSRDPDESEKYVKKLISHIAAVEKKYRGTGRPICLISHSWGTMLAHTALHRMPEMRSKVKIDRWITMGSPLMPGNAIVKIYSKLKVKQEDFEKTVSKPASVKGKWINIWAKHDIISNIIKAADSNYQIDLAVADVDKEVVQYAKDHILSFFTTRRDLFKLRTTTIWHAVYMYDYDEYIKCLNRQVTVKVFEPLVDPSVTANY